jgi:hypothetical protein
VGVALPGNRAWVSVGPPLSWSGPSMGSSGSAEVPTKSPLETVKPNPLLFPTTL